MAQLHVKLHYLVCDYGTPDLNISVCDLQNLESEQLDDQLLEPAPVPTARPAQPQAQHAQAQAAHAQPQANPPLPSVPHTRPAQAAKPNKSKEEEELEALEREMAV